MLRKLGILLLVVFSLGLCGAAYQLTHEQRITILEQQMATVQFIVNPTQEIFPDTPTPVPTATPTPNIVLARNDQTGNVRLRTAPNGAIVGNIAPGATVEICLNIALQVIGTNTWYTTSSGRSVAGNFLTFTNEQKTGAGCDR